MPFATACPHCNHTVQTASPLPVGRQVKCPGCKQLYVTTAPGTEVHSPAEVPYAGATNDPDMAGPSRLQMVFARCIGAGVLALLGLGLLLLCYSIMQTGTYELPWSRSSTFGEDEEGVELYEGLAAVRMALGFLAAACLLETWACALVWTALFPGPGERKDLTWPELGLAALSLTFLGGAMLMFFPPWSFTASALAFWLTQVGMGAAVVVLRLPAVEPYRKYGGGVIIGLIVLVGLFGAAVGFGALFGLIIAFLGLLHLFLLIPTLRAHLF